MAVMIDKIDTIFIFRKEESGDTTETDCPALI